MGTLDAERPPQAAQLAHGLPDAPHIEELRLAVHPVIVVDGHLHEPGALVLELADHLHADHATRVRQPCALQEGAADEPEVAIDVTDAEPDPTNVKSGGT